MSGNRTEERISVNEGLPVGNARNRTGRGIQTPENQQEKIWMSYCSTPSLKNAPTTEPYQSGAESFKVARDVLDAIERESPLHGIVARSLIAKGKIQVVE
jgi:hypothetical protein